MATHASAEKRHRQNLKRRARNRSVRATLASAVKKVRDLAAQGDKEGAQKQLKATTRLLDKAAIHGVIHKKNSSRRISRLAKAVG